MTDRKHEKLRVYVTDHDPWPKIAFAASAAAFRRITGEGVHVSVRVSEDEQVRRVAEMAGVGFFAERVKSPLGKPEFVVEKSKEAIYEGALTEMKALVSGQGNTPKIEIREEKGAPSPRGNALVFTQNNPRRFAVFIDSERRAYWSRDGAYWVLRDIMDNSIETRTIFRLAQDSQVIASKLEPRQPSRRVDLPAWDDILALRIVLQAWEDGALPAADVQKVLEAERQLKKQEQQRLTNAFQQISRDPEKLERVLAYAAGQGNAEAAELLEVLTGNEAPNVTKMPTH